MVNIIIFFLRHFKVLAWYRYLHYINLSIQYFQRRGIRTFQEVHMALNEFSLAMTAIQKMQNFLRDSRITEITGSFCSKVNMKRKESDLSFNWKQFTTLQKKIVFNNKSFFSHRRFSDINTPQSSSREYKSIHKNTNARHSFRNKI